MSNKIIHNVFLDIGFKPFSERLDYQKNIEHNKAMNPDFKFMLWDDAKVNTFIKTQPENIKKIWGEFPSTFYKIDFVRYLILKEYGGIYMDLDVVSKIPIEDNETIIGFWANPKNNKINIALTNRRKQTYLSIIILKKKAYFFLKIVLYISY